ncbi:MAG: nicotinate-nicotinamide nucleotide adenylyltransferase [Myxococcales bacterium]|nr:nicotinate-nicotinamide nucleotide adenylyltransferase [Myxococcales bacterium]MBP6846175.1 nicotinate-nicotinamide nucleotide adenylyltransferase [Kofleriaceae bacterium]
MITVGLFGGSFNPPHVAHALVGLYALETQGLDELWLVPTWRHAFGKQLASYDDRIAMCELVAAALGPRARVSRVEETVARARGGESRTLHTLEHLATAEPDRRFRLVIGADILGETAGWLGWDEVCRRAPPIVIGRGGVAAPPGASLSEVTMPAISSTELRRRLAAGEAVADLLPASVFRYIGARGLYRDSAKP